MPCYDARDDMSRTEINAQRDVDAAREHVRVLEEKNEMLGKILCSACRVLEYEGFDFAKNPLLDTWWHQHKIEDDARLEREMAAESARLAKNIRHRQANDIATNKKLADLTEKDKKLLREFRII